MGLIEFLDNFPESEDQPLSYAALSQLSGISRPEATELSLTWEEWTEARRLELIERLTGLQEDHNDLEFEVVFKEGLRLDEPRAVCSPCWACPSLTTGRWSKRLL